VNNFALIQQFHEKFDPQNAAESLDALLPRRLAYLLDETQEAAEAADNLYAAVDPANPSAPETIRECKAHLVKELVDVLQVTYGFLHLLNIDADAAFAEVMRSNMSKTPNPGGKALKGETYSQAEMEQFV
jgi:predicted HAD superfamily Cof-like phosphohydrolase